jgi:hypothetical protein
MTNPKANGAECPHISSCVGLMALSILSSGQVVETPYCRNDYAACPLYKRGMVDGMPTFAPVANAELAAGGAKR